MRDILTIDRFPSGQIFLPPSKSVAHRALICNALAGGGTIENMGDNEDIRATARCLDALKTVTWPVTRPESASHLSSHPPLLDCGESGSTLRFLIPLAALASTSVNFIGQGRLMERPLHVYEECLWDKGVNMQRTGQYLTVCGSMEPGVFRIPGDVSSQFVTGLLLALPLLSGESRIEIRGPLQSASYVELTLAVLADFGIRVEHDDFQFFRIPGNQRYQTCNYQVEADFSGAAFFLAAAALGRPLELMGLNLHSKQGDRAFLDLLTQAGAVIGTGSHGGLTVSMGRPKALTVDVGDIPDLVPPLAALLAYGDGESRIVNAGRLRIKESDRLATVTRQLNRLGAHVTEGPDFLCIRGKESLAGGTCHGENDHRIAMMCAVAAIGCHDPVRITGYDCVKKSYPAFWQDFLKEEAIV